MFPSPETAIPEQWLPASIKQQIPPAHISRSDDRGAGNQEPHTGTLLDKQKRQHLQFGHFLNTQRTPGPELQRLETGEVQWGRFTSEGNGCFIRTNSRQFPGPPVRQKLSWIQGLRRSCRQEVHDRRICSNRSNMKWLAAGKTKLAGQMSGHKLV